MKNDRHGLTLAAREHIAEGKPITRLEALVFFGLANLTDLVSELRKQGWVIKSKQVPYALAVRRINEHAVFKPPSNLPIREIQLTEYQLTR
ncbi:helix-turn-helix domain-containing protein [Thalassospiraceae bacterium LMO-SO8]|nr:helix-turn-helix domain-containing protein [Alphaproteobacteria bacterium LMO-S08]WND76013.1 helix-turn-helix domain-containing protein [Thalassospiraceae bacterium LMO-SO8]